MGNIFMKILRLLGFAAKPSEAVVKDVCAVVPPACDVVEHDNIICQKEAYAVLSPEGKTFTFYFDEKKSSRQGKVCGLNVENHCPEWVMMDYYATPLLMIGDITTVVFDESFKDARPVSCAYGFGGFEDLTKIEGISNLNTSEVTDMRGMFCRCQSLSSLDLSNFDTSKVTDMGDMFFCCKVLGSLDLSNFNTSKVTDMYAMFWCCERLQSLDVSNFNTSNVTNMYGMFCRCKSLLNLDLSNFDTSKVTDMSYMFFCCKVLESLDISNFNTSRVRNMCGVFQECNSLEYLDVSSFNTSQVTKMNCMFCGCKSLSSLDLSNFDTLKVKDMSCMFSCCESLYSLDLFNFNTSHVTDMTQLFCGCTNLKTIYASEGWNTNKLEKSKGMFKDCTSLVGGKGTKYDSEIVDVDRAKIDGGKDEPGYFNLKLES